MRILTWHVVACVVGAALGLAAFALVSDPYRYVAAAVIGLAGTLALWPMNGQSPAGKGTLLGGRRRLADLEAEVARLAATVARQEADRDRLLGVLRDIESWARAQDAGAGPAGPTAPAAPAEQGLRVAARTNGSDTAKEEVHGAERAG